MSLYKRDLNMECHLRRFSNTKGYPSKRQSARKRVTFYNNMGQCIRPRITFGLPIEPRFGKQSRVRKLPQTFQILWKSDVKPFGKHGVIGDNFWFQWNPTNRACHRCPHEFDWVVYVNYDYNAIFYTLMTAIAVDWQDVTHVIFSVCSFFFVFRDLALTIRSYSGFYPMTLFFQKILESNGVLHFPFRSPTETW